MKHSILTAAIVAVATPFLSYAENLTSAVNLAKTATKNTTETIIVTGNKFEKTVFDTLASVDVFDHAQIELLQPVNITDLISKAAGISVANNGGHGQESSLFVRGSNSDHVLILIDGIRVGSAISGKKSLTSISVAMVERIEIIRGPQAAIWGSDAIGGVIQIFTREYKSGGELNASIGNLDYRSFDLAGGKDIKNTNISAAISHEKESGYNASTTSYANPDNDGFEKNSFQIKTTSSLSESLIFKNLLTLDRNVSEFDNGTTHTQNRLLKSSIHYNSDQFKANLNIANSKDDEKTPAFGSRYITSRDEVNTSFYLPLNDTTQLTSGIDYFNDKVSANTAFAKAERKTIGLYLSGQTRIDNVLAELTVRRDNVEDISVESTYNWSLGYQVDNFIFVYKQSTGFKAPSFQDLYAPEAWGSIGNPTLLPEFSFSKEIVARYKHNQFSTSLSLFDTQFDNLIQYFDADTSEGPILGRSENISRASTKGFELDIRYTINKNISFKNALAYVAPKDLISNTDLVRRPRWSNLTTVNYTIGETIVLLELDMRGKGYDLGQSEVKSFTLFNVGVRHSISDDLVINLDVDNLFDEQYETINDYPAPGIFAQLGLKYRF